MSHPALDALLLAAVATLALLLWRERRARRAADAALAACAGDLDEARARQNEVRATRQNLEAIYQASGDGLALCEAMFDEAGHVVEYQVLDVNRAHAELTAATREQMLSMPVSLIDPPIDPRWFESAEKVLRTGVMHDFDVRSGATGRWINVRVSRVSDTLFQQTFVDVSDRHRLEEQRQVLLREMSHRVMNNFQMIAGFLGIQAAGAAPLAREQLKTAERRLHILAKLHSLLAYAETDRDIDAAAYVRELCGYLASTIDRAEAVTLACEAGELTLPSDTIVALGFIISELVTNSAKYAYPAPAAGAIRVSLTTDDGGWTLVIRDHGCGLGDAAAGKRGGLGTRLVERFVAQIGARLTTVSDDGVRHAIRYDAPAPH